MNETRNHSVFPRIRQSLLDAWPLEKWKSAKTIVAVSGGPDSVALLRLLESLFSELAPNNKLTVVHIDHGIRGDSVDEAKFVKNLAEQLDCNFKPYNLAIDHAHNEQALRNSRYQILEAAASETSARYVATGHNRNDQIETVLFRILRGTGVDGLAGIPFARPLGMDVALIRPLLDVSREEILTLLEELGQTFCIDKSNLESNYSRNFLRNQVIPLIEERFEHTFANGLIKLSQLATENQMLLDQLAKDLMPFFKVDEPAIWIQCDRLSNVPAALIRHTIRSVWIGAGWPQQDMAMKHWNQICEFATTDKPIRPVILPGDIRLCRNGNQLQITRPQTESPTQ